MKKLDFEKMTKFIKSRNFFIAVCVFVLTISTIGFSYASFFTVKTNSNNQTVTTGTLAVSYGEESSAIQKNNLTGISDAEGLAQSEASLIYIQNTGSLDATFTLNVGYDMENFLARSSYKESDMLTPLDYIKIAVYEYNGISDETLVVGPITVADLPIYSVNNSDPRYNRYSILFDVVGSTTSGNATKTYRVKTWLSDKAIAAASYSYFYIDTQIVAEVENAEMNYNFSGVLTDTEGNNLSNAIISLQNGSLISTTDENGAFSLNGIYPGTYNVDITYNDVIYSGNLTVVEGSSNNLSSLGTNFVPAENETIYDIANKYKTTLSKIVSANNLNTYASAADLTMGLTYNLQPTYQFTGGAEANITGFNIVIDTMNRTYTMSF